MLIMGAILLTLIAVGIGAYLYIFRSDKTDMAKEKPDYTMDASLLYQEFTKDEAAATSKYAGKIIELNGKVEAVEWNEWGNATLTFVDMMFGVTCTIDSLQAARQKDDIEALKQGDTASVKGRCDGMLTDVKMVKCVLMGNAR